MKYKLINKTTSEEHICEKKYVIINKTELLKEIEEWKNKYGNEDTPSSSAANILLNKTLSRSTPLIPEIEKAFDAGHRICKGGFMYIPSKRDYITNLKLDI